MRWLELTGSSGPAEGAEPMPNVQIKGQQPYPMLLEKLISIAGLVAALLMIPPALSADLPIPNLLQFVLVVCGLPITGFALARLLTIPIHRVATRKSF